MKKILILLLVLFLLIPAPVLATSNYGWTECQPAKAKFWAWLGRKQTHPCYEDKRELASLRINSALTGSFFLATGFIRENDYFMALAFKDDYYQLLRIRNSSRVFIHEGNTPEYYEIETEDGWGGIPFLYS